MEETKIILDFSKMDPVRAAVMKHAGAYSRRDYSFVQYPAVVPQPPPPRRPPPQTGPSCGGKHSSWELHYQPCLECNSFCNCGYTYFPKPFPDVLVRSVDKHIVRLSGAMVCASGILSNVVGRILARRSRTLERDTVILATNVNHFNSVIGYRHCEIRKSGPVLAPPVAAPKPAKVDRGGRGFLKELKEEDACPVEDIIDLNLKGRVLVLFDLESDTPTFGVTKEILMKVDRFISNHLDDVDERVRALQTKTEFYKTSGFGRDPMTGLHNTYVYEDWEEDFFNLGGACLAELHRANQELLIWDLYYTLEKWLLLARGFPKAMVNGEYELIDDPDYENDDRKNCFGLYNMLYKNPRRRSLHRSSYRCVSLVKQMLRTVKPKWWIILRKDQ